MVNKILSFEGKIGRQQFWLTCILGSFVSGLIVEADKASIYLLLAVVVWVQLSAIVRRNRDRGHTLWFLPLQLVPFVAFIDLGCLGPHEPRKGEDRVTVGAIAFLAVLGTVIWCIHTKTDIQEAAGRSGDAIDDLLAKYSGNTGEGEHKPQAANRSYTYEELIAAGAEPVPSSVESPPNQITQGTSANLQTRKPTQNCRDRRIMLQDPLTKLWVDKTTGYIWHDRCGKRPVSNLELDQISKRFKP